MKPITSNRKHVVSILQVVVFVVIACSGCGKPRPAEKLVGEWHGTDRTGQRASFVFDNQGYCTMIMGNEVIGGKDAAGTGQLKYSVNYSVTPAALDMIAYDNTGKELGRMLGIVKFITGDKILYRSFFPKKSERPSGFASEDDDTQMVLSRVK